MGDGKTVLRHFALWTSASGLPHVAKSSNKCTCLFWISALVICVIMFVYQMTCLIMNYLNYPVTVDTKLKFEELMFPVVTVCNLSPFKLSKILDGEILSLIESYKAAVGEQSSINDEKWKLKINTNDTPMEIQTRAKIKLNYITARMTDDEILALGSNLGEFIMSCTFNELECDKYSDFQIYIDRSFGVCFQFNGLTSNKTYISRRVGSNNGLRLLLNIGLDEYLPITEAVGVRIIISSRGEQIFPDAFGYNAPTGLKTSFSVKYTVSNRLGYPYSQCQDTTVGNHSVEYCYRQCFQDYIVQVCGCGDPRFPLRDNQTYCTIESYDCVAGINNDTSVSNDTSSSNAFDMKNACDCPQLCLETSFTLSVSNAVWPARSYTPFECTLADNKFNGNLSECLAWYSENTLMVEIFYERLNFQMFNENPAYPLISLVSDFGGQIGLWIGFSVITMIEFLFIPMLMFRSYANKEVDHGTVNRPKTNESLIRPEAEDNNLFDKMGTERVPTATSSWRLGPRYSINRQSDIFRVPPVTPSQ